MSIAISTGSLVTMLTATLRSNRNQLTDLSEQLSSGEKSQTLTGYGADGRRLLDLDSSIATANAYVASTTTVSTYLQGSDTALGALVSDATQLSQGIANLADPGSATSAASLAALVNGLEVDVTATLNTQAGERYLFAGTRYNTAPVQALGSLPLPTSPTAFTAVSAPNLPAYDTAAPGSDAAAWAQSNVTVAAGETVSYGVSSNDPAIQRLVYALRNAAAALQASEPDRSQYLSLAKNAADAATSALQAVQATNGVKLSQVNAEETAQQQAITTLTKLRDGISGVDTTALSVQISSLQLQMEASYKVTSSLLSLSLVGYLGTGSAG